MRQKATVAAYSRKAMKNNAAALATLCEVAKKLSDAGIVHAAFKGPVRQIALGRTYSSAPLPMSTFSSDTVTLPGPRTCSKGWDTGFRCSATPLVASLSWRASAHSKRPKSFGSGPPSQDPTPELSAPPQPEALLDDLDWTEIGGEKIPIFGPISIFLNTVMSIVKGLANREPTGGHVLDLARQLNAADDKRLGEFTRAARDQKLEKSYAVARRAVLLMTGVAPEPVPSWFVADDALLSMLLTPEDPSIRWPKHSRLLWKLVDGTNRLGRAVKFTREFAWWTAAEFSRRTHDVSQLPARANRRSRRPLRVKRNKRFPSDRRRAGSR